MTAIIQPVLRKALLVSVFALAAITQGCVISNDWDWNNECVTRADCRDGQWCVAGQCGWPDGQCRGDNDCGRGDVCNARGRCEPDAGKCTRSADCDAGEVCLDGQCAQLCNEDDECASGWRCDNRVCTQLPEPKACERTAECDAGLLCIEGKCSALCDAQTPCERGYVCQDRVCVIPPAQCAQDADCDAGQTCDQGVCRNGCTDTAECGANQVCEAGQCVPTQAGECRTNAECAQGDACVDGTCVTTCRLSCQCPVEGQVCTNGLCSDPAPVQEEPACENDCDCPSGQACVQGQCEA